jgi:predicted permease
MSDLYRVLRLAFRQLWKSPGFTLAALVSIALGIGANTTTFSFANTLIFKENPYVREPDRLVRLFLRWSSGLKFGSFSYPDYVDFRERNEVFEGLVADVVSPLHLSTEDGNERIWAAIVSANYFSVLGVDIPLGRPFGPEDDRTLDDDPVVVVTHGFWQRRLGGARDVVGRSVHLNGHPYTVIGVAPEGFTGVNVGLRPELWAPLSMTSQLMPDRDLRERGNHWIGFVIGRLKPDVTAEQAREATNALMAALTEEYPDTNEGKAVDVFPEAEASLHPMIRSGFVGFLGVMFGVVGLILLLACANVAGLLVARSVARRREIGIHVALGADRARLLRQLLTESLVLSLAGGALGLLLSLGLRGLLISVRPPSDLPIHVDVQLDTAVLVFTLAASVMSGVLFGLAPALQTTRADVVSALKEGLPHGGRRGGLRRLLVAGQVALSAVLLIAAGLAIRSLENVRRLDPGFDPDHLIVGAVDLDLQGYDETRGREFRRRLKERLSVLPGVKAVGLARMFPLQLNSSDRGAVPEGYEPLPGETPSVLYNYVDPDYFAAMGIPILSGRGFTERDVQGSPPVIVVNQTFANNYWPGQDPVGKRVRTVDANHEVVGIAKDGKYFSIGEDPKPYMYLCSLQYYRGETVIHLRAEREPEALLAGIRNEVRALDPQLPLSDLKTGHAALGFVLFPARLAAGVVGAFSALALLLAAVGLYGVIAYAASQGRHEIGVRIALGAKARDVLRLIVGQGMRLTGAGLVVGILAALALARAMVGILYGVSATEPLAFIGAAVVLAAVALVATYLPARRAARVDPVIALRAE